MRVAHLAPLVGNLLLATALLAGLGSKVGAAPEVIEPSTEWPSCSLDWNADGTADPISVEWSAGRQLLVVSDGGSGNVIAVLPISPRETALDGGVGSLGDLDGDGANDLVVTNVWFTAASDVVLIVHVYSTQTWRELGYVVARSNGDQISVSLVGDLTGDLSVDDDDLAEAIAMLGQVPDPGDIAYAADLDRDDCISLSDIVGLAGGGAPASPKSLADVLAAVEFAVASTLDPTLSDPPLSPCFLGKLKCVWCAFKCGSQLKKAADCMFGCRDQAIACFEDYEDMIDQMICYEGVKQHCYVPCLDGVAQSAGTCTDCIYKCVPRLPQRLAATSP